MGVDMRVEVVYALTVRWPLEVALAKASWRFYRRVEGELRES